MSRERLSVAMCTYNGARYLREQLDSIAAQTRQPDELVACDDGSSDETLGILRSFAETAPFEVRVYANEVNLGVAKNFEKALGLCRGDLIALGDQDDLWLPEKLESLEAALLGRGDAGLAFCNAEVVDERLRPLGYTLWESAGFEEGELSAADQFYRLVKRNFVTGACMILKAGLLPLVLPVDSRLLHDYWIAATLAASGYETLAVEERLVKYRQHTDQEVGTPRGDVVNRLRRGITNWGLVVEREREGALALEEHLLELRVPEERLREVRRKRRYLEARSDLYGLPRLRRLAPAVSLLLAGDYRRFSNHLDALAKDLLSSRIERLK